MKPILPLLALLLLTGCTTPAAPPTAAPDKPTTTVAEPSPGPGIPFERLAVGHLRQENGVYIVPPVTTLFAVTPQGHLIDFYAQTAKGERLWLGASGREDTSHQSITFEVPRNLGPELTIWAYGRPIDIPLPDGPPNGYPVLKVRPAAPAGSKLTELQGFPLFPAFSWHTNLSAAEQKELAEWLGPDWNKEVTKIAYSGRLFDLSALEAMNWTLARGEKAGWQGLVPAGGGASWGVVGDRDGVKVRVNFALGYGGGPPARPELGYGMVVRIYGK